MAAAAQWHVCVKDCTCLFPFANVHVTSASSVHVGTWHTDMKHHQSPWLTCVRTVRLQGSSWLITECFPLGGLDAQLEDWDGWLSTDVKLCITQQILEVRRIHANSLMSERPVQYMPVLSA
jgi:hypothetical protein